MIGTVAMQIFSYLIITLMILPFIVMIVGLTMSISPVLHQMFLIILIERQFDVFLFVFAEDGEFQVISNFVVLNDVRQIILAFEFSSVHSKDDVIFRETRFGGR